MSKTLVIAEKPSVAQDIVRALTATHGRFEKRDDYFEGEQFIVTSAVGHLVEIQAPEEYEVKRGKWSFAHLPVIPPHFDLKPVEKTKARLAAVVKLARRKDVTALINACDAGREGELIFRLIEQYAGGSRGTLGKPVQRLWLQSMTQQAIREGFASLRSDAQMQGLADAARSRSEADWLVGINGTRAMTAFNSRDGGFFLTTVGRVQTPTLSLVVDRESKIRRFVSRDYWEVHARFLAQSGEYSGRWFDPQFRKSADDPELRPERLWQYERAQQIAAAIAGQTADVTQESRPATQASPLLFDLTSLQREANARFGFSAKTTLALAQSLYERHKALTYPRTDSRALPEDYLAVARQTFAMLADSHLAHLAPHARTALESGYVRPHRRIFDNAKVSDHFAIIPTTQAPGELSEAEQKLYDLVARRFVAVFYPSAEYEVTTRISRVGEHHFKSEGKVLVKPGWLAVYGKEAAVQGDDGGRSARTAETKADTASVAAVLVAVQPGEAPRVQGSEVRALATRPPARYNEATLLGAMESAGKQVEDEELRSAMQEKGLGTPATRAAIIEGLLTEKYMLREGRDLIPTAKAFQLMTLLRGLGVDELSRAELTGEWEYKLAQMEKGLLPRPEFMRQIQAMTEKIVRKAKEFDRDTVPGDYSTLHTPCPHCGGVVRENYRRFACTGTSGAGTGCGFSFTKSPAGRTFEIHEAEALLQNRRIGPLEGFRSKAGWPFTAEVTIVPDGETGNFKLEFDFGDDGSTSDAASGADAASVDWNAQTSLGACPKCGNAVYAHGSNYVCSHSVGAAQPACDFKTAQTILQQPISAEQMQKLLRDGRTDLLDKFVSNRTRRSFKAFLVWDAVAGKVGFEFEQREPRNPARGKAVAAASATTAHARTGKAATTGKRVTSRAAAPATPATTARVRKPVAATLLPSPALAAVIGSEPVARTEVTRKIWDYVKAHNLQDPADRRTLVADALLRPVFGRERISMFELAGVISQHLRAA